MVFDTVNLPVNLFANPRKYRNSIFFERHKNERNRTFRCFVRHLGSMAVPVWVRHLLALYPRWLSGDLTLSAASYYQWVEGAKERRCLRLLVRSRFIQVSQTKQKKANEEENAKRGLKKRECRKRMKKRVQKANGEESAKSEWRRECKKRMQKRSAKSGFDPLAVQGEGQLFDPSETTLVQTCLCPTPDSPPPPSCGLHAPTFVRTLKIPYPFWRKE